MKRYLLSFCLCGLICLMLLHVMSRLVEPKYVASSQEGNLISEYYRESDRGREHEIIFIGDCEIYSSFVPPLLYEKYGITSFVRASPSQSMAQSYYLLCETLKYEKPRVVVLGVYAMCKLGGPSEPYNRMTLDGMRMSAEKMYAVSESVGASESIASYFFPLLRFHSRIYELGNEDVKYIFNRPAVSHNGYLMNKGIKAASGDYMSEDVTAGSLPHDNFAYLDKIAEKCNESGVALVIVKPPVSSWRYPWYEHWDDELDSYAKMRDISYYSLSAEACDVDMMHDSYDGGLHLNVYGAEKVSEYFGAVLAEKYDIGGKRNDVWDAKVRSYYNERNSQ